MNRWQALAGTGCEDLSQSERSLSLSLSLVVSLSLSLSLSLSHTHTHTHTHTCQGLQCVQHHVSDLQMVDNTRQESG
jgi:hypothetical protein